MDRKDLRSLSLVRPSEAGALLKAGLPDGAYYLAGYAVECALKACIAKETQRYEFPEKKRVNASHTHDLEELVRVADLQTALRTATKSDPLLLKYWDIVESWSEQSRYGKHSAESAPALIEAIGDRSHGVIKWVKRYW
ncbi:MAG: HEPN domain-containing protein [Bryobacteraceae bacterium]|jgi:HEPN domain-containing protein